MKKNDRIELLIEDISTDGSGIGRADGMIFFVKDAVLGDRIRAVIMKLKKSYGYAKLTEVIEPSPYRVEPRCRLHRQCGGCQLQALSYEKQLEFKQRKVYNHLMRIGGFDQKEIPMEPIIGMEHAFHYRNKAQFPIGRDKNGEPAAGFYAARTHSIIPVENCCLGVPQNQEVMQRVLAWMKQFKIKPYDEKKGTGLVRHVLVRFGFHSKQIMVCLVINGGSLPKPAALTNALAEIEGMTSISICVNRQRSNVIMGGRVKTLWGKDFIEDSIGGIRFQISPLSFYQVNPVQTEILYQKVLAYAGLTGTEIVWDLYCGIGTISLFLAQKARKVYGVEIVPQAVEDARRNAKINGFENTEFFVGTAEEMLNLAGAGTASARPGTDAAEEENLKKEILHPQVIVADPPRKGCGEKLLETIVKVRPEKVVYVSCDSATLARDLRYLCGEGGYMLEKVQVVDQFCQTVHVETIALLQKSNRKSKPDSYVKLSLDMEDYYRIKDAEGETKIE